MRQLLTALVAVMLIVVPASIAQGAHGDGKPDNPGSGQGNSGGNSGKANNPKGNLYSDLWVIARDVRGVPITVDYEVDGDGDESETATCVQPIAFGEVAAGEGFTQLTQDDWPYAVYPYDSTAYLIPLAGEDPTLDLEPCDVVPEYAGYVSEVDLGRLNLGRSPERVLSKQLGDVVAFLAGQDVSLDASGRFLVDGVALDSPLANLAAYQSILETGDIGTISVPSGLDLDAWELTAAQLAAGSPKEGFEINVDVVQYLNRILGIPADTTWADTITDTTTGEVFLDFATDDTFSYSRSQVFPGCATYLQLNDDLTYDVKTDSLINLVFDGDVDGDQDIARTGIDAYAHFAEDARQVLVYVHDAGSLLVDVDPITQSGVCAQISSD